MRERQDKLALLATLQEQEAQLRQELALHQGTQLAHEQDVTAGGAQQHAVREGEKQARRHLAGMAGAYRQVAEELKVLKQEETAAAEAARRKRLRETPAPWCARASAARTTRGRVVRSMRDAPPREALDSS